MMKAVILSDSHRDFGGIRAAIDNNLDTDLIVHAGDVQKDVDGILREYPNIPCAYVLGNNDFYAFGVPNDRVFKFGGKTVFLTHGHNYSVKMSLSRVISEAKRQCADICIFGHTHIAFAEQLGGIWVVNPGASINGRYAVLTVERGDINIELKRI